MKEESIEDFRRRAEATYLQHQPSIRPGSIEYEDRLCMLRAAQAAGLYSRTIELKIHISDQASYLSTPHHSKLDLVLP
jgi:hypothetical protein